MIFKTTDDGGLTNIFKELKSVQVTFEELDKTTLRNVIKAFNNTSISVGDLSTKFGGLDGSVVDYLKSTERGQASMEGLSKSIDNSTTSMISATAKAKILAVALNALTGLAISLAIKGITWAVDELIVTLDEQKEKLDDAVNAYKESETELANINDELKTTSARIDELNGKDNLTFTEQDELKRLIKTNDELERKIYLLEQANKEAEKEVATEAQNTYDKYINNKTLGAVEQIEFYTDSSLLEGVNWDNFKDDLSWLVAQYRNQEEILKNAQVNGWTTIEERVKSNLELLEGYMSEASLDYQDLYDKISGISDYAMTDDLKIAKQDLDDILDIVAEILGYGGQRSEISFDDIWNSEDFSKYKAELENLAKEGKLDASVLESNENYKKLLQDTGATAENTAQHINALVDEIENAGTQNPNKTDILSISATVDKLNNQLKPAMESLASVWKDIFTEDGMALEDINILSVADTIKSKLDELAKIDGITVDYSSFEDFIRILEDTSSTEEDVKNGFDKLAQSIVLAGVSGVEDFETLKSSLGDLGVVNNEIVAFEALTRNAGALKTAGLDLANATDEQIRKFTEETVAAENVEQALAILMYRKELLSLEKMSTLQEITNLKNLAISAGYTGEVIEQLTQIEIIYQKIASGVLGTNNQEVAMAMEEARRLQKSIQESLANVNFMPEVDMTNVNKGGSSSAKKTAETIDWIETLLSRIQRTITNLGKTVSATYKGWSKRNNALAQEMKEINKEINAQATAYDTYMAKANSVPLSDKYKELVRNGGFSFSEIKDEALKKNIDLYKQWYEKALNCSDAIEDLRANLAELAKTKFDNVSKQYDNQMLIIDHNIQMLQGFVEQSESAGYMASEVYYQAMAEKQQENIVELQNKYSSLLSTFD